MKEVNENNQFDKDSENFGLPEGYFQKSAGSIFNKIEWQEEHKNFSQLLVLKNSNSFTVPENYFNETEHELELIQYSFLRTIKKQAIFSVPENYFESCKNSELSKVLVNDTHELAPFDTLGTLSKKNNFPISEQYFVENETLLMQKLGLQKQTKIVSLFSKRSAYAMAAMLVVVFGLWMYDFYFTPLPVQDCGTIACLDKQDLFKAKTLENLDDEELYELVNPAALQEKLEKRQSQNFKNEHKDSGLKDVSTEDLLDEL